MKLRTLIVVMATTLAFTGCSEEKVEGYSKPAQQGAGQPADGQGMTGANQMPAGHPAMGEQAEAAAGMDMSTMPAGHPGGGQMSGGAPAELMNKELHPGGGKVLKVMHASGYTYMQVEVDGQPTWAASTAMKVSTGDKVKWADAAVMQNFTSNTLHQTFDQILFVSNASLDQ